MANNNLNVKIGANISGLKKGVNEAKGVLTDLTKSVNSMTSAFTAIASMGIVATPLAMAKQWAAAVNDLEDKTNMAGEAASRLLAIGERVGLSTDEMSNAVMRMSKTAQTSYENFGKSTDVFSKWGIAIRDTNGNLLDAETILANVATVHRNMANGVQKNAMEMEIFGRTGGKLNDLLNFSKAELDEFGKRAERVGLVLSHDVTQAFENAQFRINDAKNAIKGIAVAIGAEMLPEFTKLADYTGDVAENFAKSTNENKRFIAVVVEGIGGVGALAVGINGLAAALNFVVGAAVKAKAAIATLAGPVGLLVGALGSAGYAAYEGYTNYNAKNSKGENLYKAVVDEETDQVTWERTNAVDDRGAANATASGTNGQEGIVAAYRAAEEQKTAIKAEQAQKRAEIESEYELLQKEAKTAMREADYEEFLAFLNSEQAEKLARLQEEQDARQQLYEWQMEANASILEFEMEAAETLKESLASGISDCIVNGGKLIDVFKNIGKQIVQMFLQWTINKKMAALMEMALGKTVAKANAASATSQATALSQAAIQQSIAQLGPLAGPPAYAAAVAGMTAQAAASIAGSNVISLFANGGIVTAPTLAMIGEGKDSEAVIPLNSNSFQAIADGISEAGASNTLIINGDVNNAGDLDTIMNEFSNAIYSGLRSA